MKEIKTIPIYNRKSQKLTSITESEFKAIKDDVDERFFIVEGEFVMVKSRFFRTEHLVTHQKLYIKDKKITFQKQKGIDYKKVLFILESPHRHEYDYEKNFSPRMPLYGNLNTFQSHFESLMFELTEEENYAYEVVLYNPVPYQTSLHYLLKRNVKEQTRFKFWLYGWLELKYHREFDRYLNQYKFDYYLNASTRMYKSIISYKLSTLVNTEYQVYHPSSGFWNRKEAKFGIKKIIHLDDSHFLFHLPKEEERNSIS
ncbi:hypothetical protein [Pseudofulvibacter geojedonensis]|uniref:Uncharacterized protein n=1 Tax=Pseudofulvibacter geojedonensis TaxID=1123758 RepID=A0ABW3HXZ2_9FLAO